MPFYGMGKSRCAFDHDGQSSIHNTVNITLLCIFIRNRVGYRTRIRVYADGSRCSVEVCSWYVFLLIPAAYGDIHMTQHVVR